MILSLKSHLNLEDLTLGIGTKSSNKFDDKKEITIVELNDQLLDTSFLLKNSFMPPAVRYISPQRNVVLFERPPCYASLKFSNSVLEDLNLEEQSTKCWTIPLPWQRYVVKFASNGGIEVLTCSFAPEQIHSLKKDPFYIAPLPNFYSNGTMCLPQYTDIKTNKLDLIEAISEVYSSIWSTGFNLDTMHFASRMFNYSKSNNPLCKKNNLDWIGFYRRWSAYTIDDVLGFEWPIYFSNFFELIHSEAFKGESQETPLQNFMVDIYMSSQ